MTFDQGSNHENTINSFIDVVDDLVVEGIETIVVSGSVASTSGSVPLSFVTGRDTSRLRYLSLPRQGYSLAVALHSHSDSLKWNFRFVDHAFCFGISTCAYCWFTLEACLAACSTGTA